MSEWHDEKAFAGSQVKTVQETVLDDYPTPYQDPTLA